MVLLTVPKIIVFTYSNNDSNPDLQRLFLSHKKTIL